MCLRESFLEPLPADASTSVDHHLLSERGDREL